jgi:hypothetical protein
MSRTISVAGVRPLDWLARVRAQRSCLSRACHARLRGACAAGLAPRARARGTVLGIGARDDRARQRSGPIQRQCRRIPLRARTSDDVPLTKCYHVLYQNAV